MWLACSSITKTDAKTIDLIGADDSHFVFTFIKLQQNCVKYLVIIVRDIIIDKLAVVFIDWRITVSRLVLNLIKDKSFEAITAM